MQALFLIILLLASPALADSISGTKIVQTTCVRYALCTVETSTGVCQAAGSSSEDVADLQLRSNHVAYTTQSTATTYSCDLYTGDNGFHATHRKKVNASSLTDSNPSIPFVGPLNDVWAECPTITGGNVTLEMCSCVH